MFAEPLLRARLKCAQLARYPLLHLLVVCALAATGCNSDPGATTGPGLRFPVITTQPTAETVALGTSASFVVAASGDSLTYQWYKNGSAIGGAIGATFTIASSTLSDAGTYQAVVYNPLGSVPSDSARLTVFLPSNIIGYKQTGGSNSTTNQRYSSTTADQSAVYVTGGGDLTLVNPSIGKSGNATSLAASRQVGTNAAARVDSGATLTIVDGSVSTDSAGAPGLFATGKGSAIVVFRSAVVTTGASSDGVRATLGGTIHLERTPIRAASGTLASATGGGVVAILADHDSLVGSLVADAASTVSATLQGGATLTGFVQGAALSMDSTSTWNVTATSVLTTLGDLEGISALSITNIIGNGFTVYYSASLPGNAALGGLSYSLVGGGYLLPQ